MNKSLKVCSHINIASKTLNFIGLGNIWIKENFSGGSPKLTQFFLTQALKETAVGQLEIIGYDGDLSGIFAPFSMLSSGEVKLLKQVPSEEDLYKQLIYLKEHIRSVQNLLKGMDESLLSLRERSQETIETFKLCVIYADFSMLQGRTRELLLKLFKVGPSAGVSFLIVSYEPDNIIRFENFFQFVEAETDSDIYRPIYETITANENLLKELQASSSKNVLFTDMPIVGGAPQSLSSKDGLIFAIGKYGLEFENIVLGDEINQRHNILVTGAVGQGKSNLISVIIHSLCQNYSPDELNLYLLDFKEGVTLKAFSNIDKEDYLPHVKALGLESDVSFGKAVLDFLYEEYKKRLKLFKEVNKKSIKEYRESFPTRTLPRIVIVIDEFQLMFGKLHEAREIADILEKSVRLFRAAGIHFILSSQTIGGNEALYGKMDTLFSQIPIRIAHKNSISESQLTLGVGNTSASYLKPKEVILNLDYGELTQNKKVQVAFADEKILEPLRINWWNKYKSISRPPVIFDGAKPIEFTSAISTLASYKQEHVENIALFGQKISVTPQFSFVKLKREIGHHIAILGVSEVEYNSALGMIQAIAFSLVYLNKKNDIKFLFCNAFEKDSKEWIKVDNLINQLSNIKGVYIELVKNESFRENLEQLIEDRRSDTSNNSSDVFIFGLGMERIRMDGNKYEPPLEYFLQESADLGIHFIGWWIKNSTMEKQACGGDSELINTKILLRVDEHSIHKYGGSSCQWKPEGNRALFINETISEVPIPFVPYSWISSEKILNELIKEE